jgi:hypothetical protein
MFFILTEEKAHFKTSRDLEKKNMVMGPDGT